MAIIRLEDKYKSKYKIQLTPERHYISSSSGITGSVHVFPNRSETQKDNIDERLNLAPMVEEGTEFSGTPIRPYDSNSLEQRRIEIYRGEFNKLIGGAFADAIQFTYRYQNGNWPGLSPTTAGTVAQTGETANSLTGYNTNDKVTRENDGIVFEFDSNGQWVQGGIGNSGLLHRKLPQDDRDRSTLRYDVALGLLLDGANPFTEDHAWRQTGWSNQGNSSYTGVPASNRYQYQFSGFKIFEDELGIPYLDSPLSKKEEVNAWPPEALQPDVSGSIITNYILKGYSDLSMHPRNATKKEIIRKRANHDIFSSGSIFQKALASRIEDLDPFEPGWWTHNFNSLCLSSYTDGTTSRSPALAYHNTSNRYTIDWRTERATIEFWIKPCKEQTNIGTIVQLDNSYSVALIPDSTSLKNGAYSKYKLGIYAQHRSDLDNYTPSISESTVASGTGGANKGGVYVTSGLLNLNQWHHVVIRYGTNFNNGLLNIFIDSVSSTGGNVDGEYDINNANRQTGIFYVDNGTTFTAGDTLFVGGWSPTGGATSLWGYYAPYQEHERLNSSTSTDGFNVSPSYQLKSELQELRIWSVCRSEAELLASKLVGLETTDNLKLYIPFLFDPRTDTPIWKRLGFFPRNLNLDRRDEYYKKGTLFSIQSNNNFQYNKTQFCPNNAYIAGMPFVNVHSHLREYVNGAYPVITNYRILNDETSTSVYPEINSQTPASHKIEYFQNNWEHFKWLRSINSMIVPSDNQKFNSSYVLCESNMHFHLDAERLKLSGEGIASTSDPYEISRFYDDEVFSVMDAVNNLDPEIQKNFQGTAQALTTRALVAEGKLEDLDYISPISTTYAVPQIYYGNRIHPETIELTFTLNEDGKRIVVRDYDGSLYRMNTTDDSPKCKVGHVDYGNGIICLISPLLTSNALDNFELKLQGEKNLHVMQIDVPCPAGVANKSEHPSYKPLKATSNANESDKTVTYISSIYLHDENLNIIGKVNLAQPVQKREEDSFIFRVKVDF